MVRHDVTGSLRAHPFLEGFRPEHIRKLAALAGPVSFSAGDIIFHEGDASSFFYLLLSGTVALELPTPGRAVRVATLGGGEELGWSSMTCAHEKVFQARALEDVEALAFDGARIHHACEDEAALGYALTRAALNVVARRLHATRLQLVDVYTPLKAGTTLV